MKERLSNLFFYIGLGTTGLSVLTEIHGSTLYTQNAPIEASAKRIKEILLELESVEKMLEQFKYQNLSTAGLLKAGDIRL
jgi:hypothetical protein